MITEQQAESAIAIAAKLFVALKDLRDNVYTDLSGYWTDSTSNFMQQADQAIALAEASPLFVNR